MMKKYIWISFIMIVFSVFCYRYIKSRDKNETIKSTLSTVVFADIDNILIPISVEGIKCDSIANTIYNKMELMKSDDFINKGLYHSLDQSLEIIDYQLQDTNITLHLYIDDYNKINIRLLESLVFMFDDLLESYTVDLLFHKTRTLSSQTIYTLNNINHDLGINNFIDDSKFIHNSVSVDVYKEKIVSNQNYYFPMAYRIDENMLLFDKVNYILNHIDKSFLLKETNLKNNTLYIHLDNYILNDNEMLNIEDETKIVLSLMSLDKYDNIEIMVDKESVSTLNASNITINYFYLF